MYELTSAIYSSRKRSSPGLDRFDYGIIRSIPPELLTILLSIYNDLFAYDLFPESWRVTLLTFAPPNRMVREFGLSPSFLVS